MGGIVVIHQAAPPELAFLCRVACLRRIHRGNARRPRRNAASSAFPAPLPHTVVIVSIALVITSGATSFALSRVVRDYALRMRWIDHPNERSSHDSPTPRGGGLAIIVAAVGALIIGALTGVVNARDAVVLGVGAAVLGTVGWLDDIKTLSVALRFGVQAAIALMVVIVVGGLSSLRLGTTTIHLGLAGYLLATVGIVWSINLFNFVDGIDGFAASQAALIFAAAAILFLARGEHSMGLVAAVFGAASAGFLKLNWPPAEIFMGDVGSVSIGFLLATMSIMSENRGSVPLLTFAILGALPIADATVTLVRRLARGNKPV